MQKQFKFQFSFKHNHFNLNFTKQIVYFLPAEEVYWNSSPCSSDSHNGRDCSPSRYQISNQSRLAFSNQSTPVYYPMPHERPEENYEEVYYTATSTSLTTVPFVRVVKRRTTANKKERRRTQSINSAFAYLRDCIPNVPSDTKLSKVNLIFDSNEIIYLFSFVNSFGFSH